MAKGLAKYVHYNKVLSYQGSFLCFAITGEKKYCLLYQGLCYIRGLLCWGSTVQSSKVKHIPQVYIHFWWIHYLKVESVQSCMSTMP